MRVGSDLGFSPEPHVASKTYVLAPGESLCSVAKATRLTEAQILDANRHFPIPALIGPGDRLVIPATTEGTECIGVTRDNGNEDEPVNLPPVYVPGTPPPLGGGGGVGGGGGSPRPPEGPGEPGGGGSAHGPTEATNEETFKQLLGEDLWELVQLVPELAEVLQQLFNTPGWRISVGDIPRTRFDQKFIEIPSTDNVLNDLAHLIHELGHFKYGSHEDRSTQYAFIQSMIRGETAATTFFLSMRAALAAKGVEVPLLSTTWHTAQMYQDAWDNFQIHGNEQTLFDAVYDVYMHHERTASGVLYSEHYGNEWNRLYGGGGGVGGGGGYDGGGEVPPYFENEP